MKSLNDKALAKYCKDAAAFQMWKDLIFNEEAVAMLNSQAEQFMKDPAAAEAVVTKGLEQVFGTILEIASKTTMSNKPTMFKEAN